MYNSRKWQVALLASVFLAALYAGSAFGAPAQEEPAMEAKEVTLRIFARAYTWDQEAPWEVAKAEIQKRHPNTKFTFVEEGFGWEDLRAKFLTAAAGGNPPDVAQVDIIWVGEYVEGGLLMDLTDKLNAWSAWPDVVDSFKEGTKWKVP